MYKDYEIISYDSMETKTRGIDMLCLTDMVCECVDVNCGDCSGPDIECSPNLGACGTRIASR